MLILAAVLGLVGLLCRRSLWRAVMHGTVFLILLTVGVVFAIALAGPHWPWIAVAAVLLVAAVLTWKMFHWARAVHAVSIARAVWFGWQFVIDIWDARAVARASRPLPPRSM
jgi:Ca2+/Na+ antiporter